MSHGKRRSFTANTKNLNTTETITMTKMEKENGIFGSQNANKVFYSKEIMMAYCPIQYIRGPQPLDHGPIAGRG